MRGSAPAGPPPTQQSVINGMAATIRELRAQITSLTETVAALSARADAQHNSLRDGVIASAAVAGVIAERVGNLEHVAQCEAAVADNGDIPDRAEEDDVVARVIGAMDAHLVPEVAVVAVATPSATPTPSASLEPVQRSTAARVAAPAPAPAAPLPPPPPPPPVFNRPANATGAMLSGVRRRKWGVS